MELNIEKGLSKFIEKHQARLVRVHFSQEKGIDVCLFDLDLNDNKISFSFLLRNILGAAIGGMQGIAFNQMKDTNATIEAVNEIEASLISEIEKNTSEFCIGIFNEKIKEKSFLKSAEYKLKICELEPNSNRFIRMFEDEEASEFLKHNFDPDELIGLSN